MRSTTERCSARAKGSGEQCRLMVRGGGVCRVHGGAAPQVRRRRLERVALAEALASSPRRHPGEVLLDALHTADVLARDARARVAGGLPSAEAVLALVEAIERAARLAKTTMDADVDQRHAKVAEQHIDTLEAVLRRALELAGLTDGQRGRVLGAVPAALAELVGAAASS